MKIQAGIYPDTEAQSSAKEFLEAAKEIEEGTAKDSKIYRLLGVAQGFISKGVDSGVVVLGQRLAESIFKS